MSIKTVPSINKMLEDGINKEIDNEVKFWDERLFTQEEFKASPLNRFPLSPSQGGKCALALARNVSHYLGRGNYPRLRSSTNPRKQRVFARGHLLEEAMVQDINKYTPLRIEGQQKRLKLFSIGRGPDGVERFCEGNIDGLAIWEIPPEEQGDTGVSVKILLDFKSKGARYSKNFSDTIEEFFQMLRQTGLVQEIYENSFLITDAGKLFDVLSLDDFFVDYLLQLNGYAFGLREDGIKVDFVSLFYENKNSSAYYEIRWIPSQQLFDYVKKKYTFIWDQVHQLDVGHTDEQLMALVPREFSLGSSRCYLCEHKELCYGKETPVDSKKGRIFAKLDQTLDKAVTTAFSDALIAEKAHETVLTEMDKQKATHIQLSNGMVFERKLLKSPKPHYELRQVKG